VTNSSRARNVKQLLALLRPYRGRVILMFVALTLATAASLAPPYLAAPPSTTACAARTWPRWGL